MQPNTLFSFAQQKSGTRGPYMSLLSAGLQQFVMVVLSNRRVHVCELGWRTLEHGQRLRRISLIQGFIDQPNGSNSYKLQKQTHRKYWAVCKRVTLIGPRRKRSLISLKMWQYLANRCTITKLKLRNMTDKGAGLFLNLWICIQQVRKHLLYKYCSIHEYVCVLPRNSVHLFVDWCLRAHSHQFF